MGAFSAQTGKIYLSEALVTGDVARLRSVLIEEIGHFVDAQVNTTDTVGDEGELFSALVRGVGLSAAEVSRIKMENDHAVVSIDQESISIEQAMALVGSYDTGGVSYDVQVINGLAYVVNGDSSFFKGLQIVDISNPSSPILKGSYSRSDSDYKTLEIVVNYAYIANYGMGGLEIIDISNPFTPVLVGTYNITNGAYGLQINGQTAYIASAQGFKIIDISNPASPTLKGESTISYSYLDVWISGNFAYLSRGASGLEIFDISNPSTPIFKGSYDTSGSAFGVQVVGNLAYIADQSSGLQIIDVSNPSDPILVGNYDTSGFAWEGQIVGDFAYIADQDAGLQVINISNPSAPTLAGNLSGYATHGTYGLQVAGNYAYVANFLSGLGIIDVSDFNNSAGIITFSNSQFSVNEDGTPITQVTLTRTGGSTGEVSVTLNLTDGTATAGSDYDGIPINVTFADGETSKTVDIPIINYTLDEGDETVNLTLSDPTGGAALGTQQTAILSIVDNDQLIFADNFNHGVSSLWGNEVGNWQQNQGVYSSQNPSYSPITYSSLPYLLKDFTVELDINQVQNSGIFLRSTDNGNGVLLVAGGQGGIDTGFYWHIIQNGILSEILNPSASGLVQPGISNIHLKIEVVGDNYSAFLKDIPTPVTTLTTSLFSVGKFALDQAPGIQSFDNVKVYSDIQTNTGVIFFNSSQFSVNEDGTPVNQVTLTRTEGNAGEVSVTLNLTDGTATADNDYDGTPLTVTFADGEISKTVNIPIIDDIIYEGDETLNLTLSDPTGGATLGTQQTAILNIVDNETPPPPSLLQVRINLLKDNGGNPGEIINNDQIGLYQSFFVEILVGDFRDNAVGVNGIQLDFNWDGFILESLNSPFDPANIITSQFPLLQGGILDNPNGLIDDFSGGSLPDFELGQAIGINQLDRFALLHFYAENITDGTSYFTTTVDSVSLADDASYTLDVETAQPIEILGSTISITDNSGDANDARIRFTTELSQFRPNYQDSNLIRPNYADSRKYFDIINTGSGTLTISELRINVAGVNTDLDLTQGDLLLNPNESQRVNLTYTPAAAREVFDRSDALVLVTNAVNAPELAIALAGQSTFNSDINYDGKVGVGDLGSLNLGKANLNKGIYDPTADINGDGLFNNLDVTPLQSENKLSLFA